MRTLLILIVGSLIAVFIGRYASGNPELLMQGSILAAVLIPGFILAANDSNRLIPYVITIWLIGPELRRLNDWVLGDYSSLTLLSLTPLITTLLLLIPVGIKRVRIENSVAKVLNAYLIPFLYAAVLGVLLNKTAGIYSTGNYFIPLLIFVYMIVKRPDDQVKQSWLKTMVTMAVLLSVYAWIQYLILPPWDLMWMEGAKMVSLGKPEPLGFRPFSTLNSTGTLSVFLVAAILAGISSPQVRKPFGMIGVIIIISALGITLVRASWVVLLICLLAYVLLSSKKNRLKSLGGICILFAGTYFVLPLLPGGASMMDRVGTFGSLGEDHSANARLSIVFNTIPELFTRPLGGGFGSIGKSTDLNGGEGAFNTLNSVDNGYLGVFAVFGLVGGLLFFRALFMHWKLIYKGAVHNTYRVLGLVFLINLMVAYVFGGELVSMSALIFWFFTGMGVQQSEEQLGRSLMN
ncbi:hypothetical protein CGZ75_22115 [Paenibacillus herberti]|uniref:O-antigen ligase-related domain-containing protein n=1 Tax=Paenibacillus herberti TaxID=1619309 RepID=A0A229NUY3_9BACL|nr:hypothetical protein CGZ75_22115 [Paenibacillus herberti]